MISSYLGIAQSLTDRHCLNIWVRIDQIPHFMESLCSEIQEDKIVQEGQEQWGTRSQRDAQAHQSSLTTPVQQDITEPSVFWGLP